MPVTGNSSLSQYTEMLQEGRTNFATRSFGRSRPCWATRGQERTIGGGATHFLPLNRFAIFLRQVAETCSNSPSLQRVDGVVAGASTAAPVFRRMRCTMDDPPAIAQTQSGAGCNTPKPSLKLLPAILGLSAVLGLAGTLLWHPRPMLIWNGSTSSPLGLYAISRAGHPIVGDLIVAWAPPAARRLAARRKYLPLNVPIIKRVAAVQGDSVCAKRSLVLINGHPASLRQSSDRRGRPLPWWNGCKVLGKGELFLLSRHAPFAFDGRYFGMTQARQVVGKARLLWPS